MVERGSCGDHGHSGPQRSSRAWSSSRRCTCAYSVRDHTCSVNAAAHAKHKHGRYNRPERIWRWLKIRVLTTLQDGLMQLLCPGDWAFDNLYEIADCPAGTLESEQREWIQRYCEI